MDNITKEEILLDCQIWLKDYVENVISDLFARLEEKLDREYSGSIGKLERIETEIKDIDRRLRLSAQDKRKYVTSAFYGELPCVPEEKMIAEKILDNDFDE